MAELCRSFEEVLGAVLVVGEQLRVGYERWHSSCHWMSHLMP